MDIDEQIKILEENMDILIDKNREAKILSIKISDYFLEKKDNHNAVMYALMYNTFSGFERMLQDAFFEVKKQTKKEDD